MSIKLGNKFFKGGRFEDAILEYEKIGRDTPLFAHASANILLAKKAIQERDERQNKQKKDENADPKISIIVPIFNVAPYIRECLDSIVNQTLRDIEVICVNDGSTDESVKIIEEYSEKFSHFKVIHKPNGGYGTAVNRGLESAKGDYVGIVEPDDFISSNMYLELYKLAKESDCDVARGTAIAFANNTPIDKLYGQPPTECLETTFSLVERPEFLLVPPAIWSAIYKRKFLETHRIVVPETPGASFQDVAFFVLTSFFARSIRTTWRPFYYYRNDNPAASRFNKGKINVIFDLFRWLDGKIAFENEGVHNAYIQRKLNDFRWSYHRVADEYKPLYVSNAYIEMDLLERKGNDLRGIGPRYRDFIDIVFNRSVRSEIKSNKNEKNGPFLSVVAPVFNAESYIESFVENILSQSFGDFELLLIDDGSTDGSLQVMRKLADRDGRISVIPLTKNQGASNARNEGISRAKGEYVRFVDVDDLLPQESFQRLCEIAIAHGSDVVKGQLYGYDYQKKKEVRNEWGGRIYEEDKIINAKPIDIQNIWNLYDHQCYLIRRSIISDAGLLYPILKNFQDPPFIAAVLSNAQSVSIVPQCVYYLVYNRGITTITRRKWTIENYRALTRGYADALSTLSACGLLAICQYKMNTFIRDWHHKLNELAVVSQEADLVKICEELSELYRTYKYELTTGGEAEHLRYWARLVERGRVPEAIRVLKGFATSREQHTSASSVVLFDPPWTERNPYLGRIYAGALHKVEPGDIFTAYGWLCGRKDKTTIFHLHWTDMVFQKIAKNEVEANNSLYDFIDAVKEFKKLGGRFIWTMHNYHPHEVPFRTQEDILTKYIVENADGIITHAESGKRHLLERLGARPDAVAVAPHGNYIGIYPDKLSRADARSALKVVGGIMHFLFVGQVRPYKGVEEFIAAFERVRAKHASAIMATIAGGVPDAAYREKLTGLIAKIDGMRFVARFLPDEEMEKYIKSADFIVLPYKNVLTSGTVMLAFSYGQPVIVPDVEEFAKLVEDGENGIVYGDRGLEEAILRAYKMNDDELSRMRRKALETAHRYDWSEMIAAINGGFAQGCASAAWACPRG